MALAIERTSIYWVNTGSDDGGDVVKMPLAGGTPTKLATEQNGPSGIAVDATSVYWTTADTVMKVPLAGGVPTTLASGQSGARSVAVDATSVYWADSGVQGGNGTVMKIPLAGGTPTTLASGPLYPYAIAIDATSIYWVTNEGDAGTVMKVPLAGGAPTMLVTGIIASCTIAVDATNVYWATCPTTNESDSKLMKVPVGGGTATTLGTAPQSTPSVSIAVDATKVYWGVDNAIFTVPTGGGSLALFAARQTSPSAIVVGPTAVYWTDYGNASGGFVVRTGICKNGSCQ